MKTIGEQNTVFGDYYYNSSRKEIVDLASSYYKYPLSDVASYLKVIMQDILAHIVGSTSFMDACMVRDKLHFEAIINSRIGKRKLVEFFVLLEELDKLGMHLDEISFIDNENDLFLERVKNNISTCRGINLSYLNFHTLDEFLEMIINASAIRPMARRHDEFNLFIPDPVDFDFKNNYYESIDYLMYYQDKTRHDAMMDKHQNNGREINLIEWINNYRQRYSINEVLGEKTSIISTNNDVTDKDIEDLEDEFLNFVRNNEYDFSDDELVYLSEMIRSRSKEILLLFEQIKGMRTSVLAIMQSQDMELSNEEIEVIEKEYVMETVVNKMTGKKRKKKAIVGIVFATIIAGMVLIPQLSKDENTLERSNKNYIEVSFEKEKEEEEKEPEEPIKLEDEQTTPGVSIEVVPSNINPKDGLQRKDEDTYTDDDEEVLETEFKIGEKFNGHVPYYVSSTSDEIVWFLDEEVVVIGYFAVLDGDKGPVLFKSFRTQEELDKFLRLYHGDHSDIRWRAAVARANNEVVQRLLESGEEIPYDQTLCFIDCVPVKQKELIK